MFGMRTGVDEVEKGMGMVRRIVWVIVREEWGRVASKGEGGM